MRYTVLILFFLSLNLSVNAQVDADNLLEKNYNVLAENLIQDLSVSRDSLVLKNDKLFSKVHFFNENFEKTFYFKPAVTKGMISLQQLPLGSYSVMFYQTDKIIVFRIDRKSKFENTIESLDVKINPDALAEANIDINRPASGIDNKDLNSNPQSKQSLAISGSGLDLDNPNNLDFASNGTNNIMLLDNANNNNKLLKRRRNKDGVGTSENVNFRSKSKNSVLDEEGMHPYDLSNNNRDHVQTREEYRSTHLRPNGKPYN